MLSVLLVPVLLGLSMLAQRPVSRALKVNGPVWPLLPFAPEVSTAQRLAVRGAGLLLTFVLVLGALFFQTLREQRLTTRVDVAAGLPAARAGVAPGDVITAVDGVEVADFGAVRDELLQGAPTKRLSLVREGRRLEVTVTLEDHVLGVSASGEARDSSGGAALVHALRRLTRWPVFLTGSRPVPLSMTLALSWWLLLLVELTALTLEALLRGRR